MIAKAVTSKPSQNELGARGLKWWIFAHEGDGPLFMTLDDLVCLTLCTRPQGCRSPSLSSLEEKEAYAKLATLNSKVSLEVTLIADSFIREF